ncbi:glycosyltransferase family 2 protein [Polynucleobacter sp. MWH-Jannik1A5]|nr:glycosyltransferase family 2 protein [Polynucleobacter sp. MWH-Jannik1A5]
MMKSRAPVSVIIPCFCCASTIGRAVESILSQTLLPAEIILVDDCSNDEGLTVAKLKKIQDQYQNEIKIVVLEMEENDGPGSSRNLGWSVATQLYIAFLDADDSWHPQKIEIQYGLMKSHPEAVLSGHLSKVLLKEGDLPVASNISIQKISLNSLLLSNCLPTRSVMLKAELTERFFKGKRQAEDYLLWLQIALTGAPIFLINAPLAFSYKADFGSAGLNANLHESFLGVKDTYRKLWSAGQLSFWSYSFYIAMAYVKHLRRQALVGLRRSKA